MLIRLAELADAEAIRTIYNVEVLESTNTFDMVPRTRAEQEAWILEHSGVHPAVVAIDEPGSGTSGPIGARERSCSGSAASRAIATVPATRPRPRTPSTSTAPSAVRGIGRALLAELLAFASAHGFHSVIARIAGHNETSIALHRAAGFELVGVELEVGRKHRQWLDVVEMQRLL